MKLHEDRETFGVLLNEIGEVTCIRTDILEVVIIKQLKKSYKH